ncbi:MAG: tRNA pseudouridine(13) synthase TruD [Legionella sp.]|nr:tRNA pseudouridine(13) synthase TruD [Legionella sp.]
MMFDYTTLAFANGKPAAVGSIKSSPDDFKVDEILGFELTGEGEHLFLLIEKRGLNTEELVKKIASVTGYSERDISYAGIKDRQAVTRQWLSIQCPGQEIADANALAGEGWRVIETKRHLKKLKTGALTGNKFQLTIRDIQGNDEIETRLQHIKHHGIPNYFGAQRFGFDGQNLVKAKRLLIDGIKTKNRFLKGMYYSTARSFLFNLILSERIKQGNWNKALPGDVMQLDGKNSIFTIDAVDDIIQERVKSFDVSPASPLWGVGKELVSDEALIIQQQALADFEPWCAALETHKLERSYRALMLKPRDMSWEWQDDTLVLNFSLQAGSYATSVMREVLGDPIINVS